MPAKLNPRILETARNEADQHLLSDLHFAENLHGFLRKEIVVKDYLLSEFGFKKFINDYGVGRTLKGGDEAKLKILKLLQTFPFEQNHVLTIATLAKSIQRKGLSSNSSSGLPGLPQSFSSKLLYVYRPDAIIPYDSYVIKSLQRWSGLTLKTLDQYYAQADQFRLTYFSETSAEVQNKHSHTDKKVITRISALQIDPIKLLSWKLTDKYLWCEEWDRKTKKKQGGGRFH